MPARFGLTRLHMLGGTRKRVPTVADVAALPTAPASRTFGYDRGQPIDRRYIDEFLREHAGAIRGRVLEVADDSYTRTLGGRNVTRADVLHVAPEPGVTVVGNLETGEGIPSDAFDAIGLTQTLQFVFDTHNALATLRGALAGEGTLLITVPGISQISRYDADRWGEYWRFTPQGLERLLAHHFGAGNVAVQSYGNAKTAAALLYGLAQADLASRDWTDHDDDYPVLVAGSATRR
jgi:hypothetical protein